MQAVLQMTKIPDAAIKRIHQEARGLLQEEFPLIDFSSPALPLMTPATYDSISAKLKEIMEELKTQYYDEL